MAINRNALKTYAPKARLHFIQAMKNRAALFGITKDGAGDGELKGEVYIVEGRPWPKHVAEQRRRLVTRIRQTSFDQVMEAVAYTWFNRFLAIRYMEVHDYFDHGFRVLSSPKGDSEPQILTEAAKLDLPGLKHDDIVRLKLDGTQDEVLYRKILIAQCNDLNRAMPFLFEKIEDETELLLPENLLQSDSIVRKLVGDIGEAEWDQIEIIGWLYQFYISDKKDQVIGKVVKSEDIPAATQLFTPNWIVKYMVQNSLGATWLGTYPDSALKAQMEYYIEPAEQTPEVNAQLAAITPKSLNPETLTLIDPAVGSGHILVEAYDLFKAIYIERGYSAREAARLILTKNLYGLDIDDRAAQMAGFALLMKARADDRSLLRDPPVLNVRSLQESNGINADAMIDVLLPKARVELIPSDDLMPETLAQPTLAVTTNADAGTKKADAVRALLETFKDNKTYGSLVTVPNEVVVSLPIIDSLLNTSVPLDLLRQIAFREAVDVLKTFVAQAKMLSQTYDAVVANPPYMGGKGLNPSFKVFAKEKFKKSSSDTFAMFLMHGLRMIKHHGIMAMVTMEAWMFLSSFEEMRADLLNAAPILGMVHMPYLGKGGTSMGINFGTAATIFRGQIPDKFKAVFSCIRYYETDLNGIPKTFPVNNERYKLISTSELRSIPGSPTAYWISDALFKCFSEFPSLGSLIELKAGLSTGDNNVFQRKWYEISLATSTIANLVGGSIDYSKTWYPCHSGGDFRKWYGNHETVVNWKDHGKLIKSFGIDTGKVRSAVRNEEYYFRDGITWSKISSYKFSGRYRPIGFVFDDTGRCGFSDNKIDISTALALFCSPVSNEFLQILCPTLSFTSGEIAKIPFNNQTGATIEANTKQLIEISKRDWDFMEYSWDFDAAPILNKNIVEADLSKSYENIRRKFQEMVDATARLECENNGILINAYSLQESLSPNVPLNEISLTCNPHYRYGNSLAEADLQARLKSDTMRELLSYAVGCMMGRYSLDEPGLIYAHAGNVGFDASRYGTFAADSDGIIPLTEEVWFDDDAAHRIEEFLAVAWPDSPPAGNLAFLIDGLVKGHSEDPRGDLRDYLSKKFYPDHLQTYKNRPIYWLFSSGKLKAFECLVYLHRYNEGTLARMRTEYVTPLMSKMSARIEGLDSEILTSTSSSEKTAKTRTVTKLRKQLEELRTFDEELHHLADRRIALDLDDGVKVNYGKFGDLLAYRTKVCGKDDSE